MANLSDTVKQNAAKLPDPVANVVTAVADQVKGSTATDSSATAATDTGATLADSDAGPTFTDTTVSDPTTPQSPPHTSSSQ